MPEIKNKTIMLHGHGNDLHLYKNIIADFSSNVWFEGPPPALLRYIQSQIGSVANYPEPTASSFCEKTEAHFNIASNSVLATNGSAEAFYLIARNYAEQSATILFPSFAEYYDACKSFNLKIALVNNETPHTDYKFNTKTVWIGNPNNPDGKVISIETVKSWLSNNPQTIFIIDEAYAELCLNFESAIALLSQFQNLIIIKSFTKAFAIPGLRLGIILASPTISKEISQYQIPWSVNSIAAQTGIYILKNYKNLLFSKNLLLANSTHLQDALIKLPHLEVQSSLCNYKLVKLKQGTAAQLKHFLAIEKHLLIRNANNFYGLTPQHFRVATQSIEKNELLIQALSQWNLC